MNVAATGMALLAIVGAAFPVFHLYRNRAQPGALPMLALCVVLACYPLDVLLLEGEIAVRHRFAFISLVAPLYLIAVFAYLRLAPTYWSAVRNVLIAYMPIAFLAAWLGGDWYITFAAEQPFVNLHHFIYSLSAGAWAMKLVSYVLILTAAGAAMQSLSSSRASGIFTLSLAAFPMCAGFFDLIAALTKFSPYYGITTVQISCTIGLYSLSYALIRHQLLSRAPVSRNTLMSHLREGVCVISEHGEIVDCNDALGAIVGVAPEKMVGRLATRVLPEPLLIQLDISRRQGPMIDAEVELDSSGRCVSVCTSNLEDGRATVLSVTDITARRRQLAEVAAAAGELRDSNERLEELSSTDALTGLGNRRQLQSALAELARSDQGGAMGLIMVDIDHFKSINDTHGHQAGDQVLIRLAGAMRDTCRDIDTIVRWGGEEFVVLVSDSDEQRLQLAAERLRLHIRRLVIELPNGVALQVTASIGATVVRPGQSSESALRQVDRLMYEAKKEGRDRVKSSRQREL